MKADLHIHSVYSNDGELGIPEIIELCHKNRVDTFSVTDHNSVRGSREVSRLTTDIQGIDFIPGIEIDCNYQGTDLHLLGYQVDLEGDDFDVLEKNVRQKHMDAVPRMIHNLNTLGIEIDQEQLMVKSGGEPPSGELIAEHLLAQAGMHHNPLLKPYLPGGERSEMPLINFYLDFFAQGKPAYVKIDHMDFKEAIEVVRSNGGAPVVAHPGLNLAGNEQVVNDLIDLGAAGLEVFNNYHNKTQVLYFAELAGRRGALMTCGSDFHGKNKPLITIGQYHCLMSYGQQLEKSLETIRKYTKR
jgi:3',5'-nucleoside bisphosphate phosphatase